MSDNRTPYVDVQVHHRKPLAARLVSTLSVASVRDRPLRCLVTAPPPKNISSSNRCVPASAVAPKRASGVSWTPTARRRLLSLSGAKMTTNRYRNQSSSTATEVGSCRESETVDFQSTAWTVRWLYVMFPVPSTLVSMSVYRGERNILGSTTHASNPGTYSSL